jgi:hypothetical protein
MKAWLSGSPVTAAAMDDPELGQAGANARLVNAVPLSEPRVSVLAGNAVQRSMSPISEVK